LIRQSRHIPEERTRHVSVPIIAAYAAARPLLPVKNVAKPDSRRMKRPVSRKFIVSMVIGFKF
jgi:hypothetical protein